jgi:hypothetical protein
MTKLGIQISLDDLIKIMGGNEEAHVNLRQSVATEFAKRYLGKSLDDAVRGAIGDAVHKSERDAKALVDREVTYAFARLGFLFDTSRAENARATGLTEQAKKVIQSVVESANSKIVAEAVHAYCASEENQRKIADEVERRVNGMNSETIAAKAREIFTKALRGT